MSFNSKLIDLLKTNHNFVDDEGELLIAAVQDRAWMIDRELVKLLLSDKEIKAKFFDEIEGHWIFNINTFLEYISQKNFLDNSYTRFRNRIGLTIGEKYLRERGEVSLVWAYKDTVLEGGQTKEEEKRKEIFFNEILAQDEINRLLDPKILTNFTRYTAKSKQSVKEFKRDKNGLIRENLILKGNNLIALHTLKTQFRGQVKLIYIDPPFNTGNDSFGYNDNFSHSSWLTFMKNRLDVARELLRNNGVIFIHIDDKEYSYLKVLCDEIFGRENFLNVICVKTSDPSGHKTVNPSPYSQTEYILLYAKNKQHYEYQIKYVESDYDTGYNQIILNKNESFAKWKITNLFDFLAKEKGFKDTREANKKLGKFVFQSMIAEYALQNRDNIFQPTAIADDAAKDIVEARDKSKESPEKVFRVKRDSNDVYIIGGRQIYFYSNKVKEIDGVLTPAKPLTNLWSDIPYNGISKEGGVTLKNGKKPEKLLRRIIEISTNPKDLVLDFFSGSGTTVAVSHKMGRQYIGVEQISYDDNDTVSRLDNVLKGDTSGISNSVNWQGGGDFIYCELMTYNEAFMERIQAAKNIKELLKIWHDMTESSFLNWYVNPEMPEEAIKYFEELGKEKNGLENQKQELAKLLDKNQLYVNLSEIDDAQFKVSKEDKALNKAFFGEA